MPVAVQEKLEALRQALAAETGIRIDDERWSVMDLVGKCAWILAVLKAVMAGDGSTDSLH